MSRNNITIARIQLANTRYNQKFITGILSEFRLTLCQDSSTVQQVYCNLQVTSFLYKNKRKTKHIE